jgi:hypothetical protein
MIPRRYVIAAFAALPAVVAFAATADAGRRPRNHGGGDGVIATSRFGNGSVIGAVRPTSVGPQVQLPSGSWVYCRRSCSETLRVETVDLNEEFRYLSRGGQLAAECGIFGCLEIKYPHD